jgi:hypothetical protein
MPMDFCYHEMGPVLVRHRRGAVVAQCLGCPAVLSTWSRDGVSEAVELRGVLGEVKHHLHTCHPHLDFDVEAAEVLRACAWHDVVDTDHLGERVPARP